MSAERSCEHCGCTDDNACEGGCCWSAYYRQMGRWVCSQCVRVVKAAEVNA